MLSGLLLETFIHTVEFKLMPYFRMSLSQNPGRKLQNASGLQNQGCNPKRRQALIKPYNSVLGIEINDINRDSHPECVNSIAGHNPEPSPWREFLSRLTNQTFDPAANGLRHICFISQANAPSFVNYNALIGKHTPLYYDFLRRARMRTISITRMITKSTAATIRAESIFKVS
jgi:hypothetical protein